MKRKATDITETDLGHKRAKVERPSDLIVDQPEIFGKILSYLISKPRNAINFSMASSKLYSNLHNATAWNQLGFKFSIVNEGRIDTYSVTLALQKIDNDRLVEKNLKIQKKIAAHGLRRYKRDAKVALFGPGSVQSEEGLKFAKLRDTINAKYGITKDMPATFYEQIVTNQILNDSIIKSIADNIGIHTKGGLMLIPELFKAFRCVLGNSRADLEKLVINHVHQVPINSHWEISQTGRTFPYLRSVEDDEHPWNCDSFIVCSAVDYNYQLEWGDQVAVEFSCFFRYCCNNTKAVIFDTQYANESQRRMISTAYYKVNLVNKCVELHGSLHNLARQKLPQATTHEYSRLTLALTELFEDATEEVPLERFDASQWLYACAARAFVVRSLADGAL
jgi:hypothetical protein